MTIQQLEYVDLGEVRASNKKTTVFVSENVGTSLVVTIFDIENKVGAAAHIVLPESTMAPLPGNIQLPGKFADLAIPLLMQTYMDEGGQKRSAIVRMAGGAQLFNFGGGGGNMLNIGARNATAIRAAMSKQGLAIEKADTGGNKSRKVRLMVGTGQMFIQQIGATEYLL